MLDTPVNLPLFSPPMDKPPAPRTGDFPNPESGFDDFSNGEISDADFKALTGCDPLPKEEFNSTIAPWPLAFTIFGLGLIGAVIYQIVSYVLR